MRFLKNIPNSTVGINLFSVNGKTLIKFEKSGMEISFKVLEEEYTELEELEKKVVNPIFLSSIHHLFNELSQELASSIYKDL